MATSEDPTASFTMKLSNRKRTKETASPIQILFKGQASGVALGVAPGVGVIAPDKVQSRTTTSSSSPSRP